MASKIPTKSLTVELDIDLKGNVRADQLVAQVKKELESIKKKVQSKDSLPLDFDVDLKSLRAKLDTAIRLVENDLNKQLKRLGTSGSKDGNVNLATRLRDMLSQSAVVVDQQGRIVKGKLHDLLTQLAKETNNTGAISARGSNRLKEFLDLEGKTVDEATAALTKRASEYKKQVTEFVKGSRELTKEIQGTVKAQDTALKSLDSSITKKQDKTRKREAEFQNEKSKLAGSTALAKQKYETAVDPKSDASDATRISLLGSYTSALRTQVAQLELAQKAGKAYGSTNKEIQAQLKELRAELGRVDPTKFDLTGNLRDALQDVPRRVKTAKALLKDLRAQDIELGKATAGFASTPGSNPEALAALERELKATRALLLTKKSLNQVSNTDRYAGDIADLEHRVAVLDTIKGKITGVIKAEKDLQAVQVTKTKAAADQEAQARKAADAQEARDRKATELAAKRAAIALQARSPTAILGGLGKSVDDAELQAQHQRSLRESIDGTAVSNREKLRVLLQVQKAEEKLLDSIRRLDTAEKQLGITGTSTSEKLGAQRQALAKLNSEVSVLDNIFVQASRSVQLFFRYAVLYQVMYSFAAAIKGTITEVLALQEALVGIKAVAGATDTEMRGISAAVKEVAQSTAFSVVEVAKGGQTLVQAGVQVKDFGETLKATANLASATGSTFQESADIITTFQEVFTNVNPAEIADKLRNAVNISKLSINDLKTIANYLLETSDSFNISIDNFGAAAATLRNAGIKASTIGTGLRQGLLELFSPDQKVLKGLQRQYASIGQDLSQETIKAMFQGFAEAKDPLLALINELQKLGVGSTGDRTFTRVLDVRGENAIKTLVRSREAYIANSIAIKESGTAAEGAQTQLEAFNNSWQNFVETITNTVYDAFEGTVVRLTKVTNSMTTFIDSFKKSLAVLREGGEGSGLGGATVTGASVLIASMVKQFTIGRSLVLGVLSGLAAEIAKVLGATSTSAKKFSDAIEAITAGLLANSVIKGVASKLGGASKVKGAIVGAAADTGTTVAEAAVALSIGKLKGILATVGKFLLSRSTLIGAAFVALYELADHYLDFFGKTADDAAAKAQALEDQTAALEKSKQEIEVRKTSAQEVVKQVGLFRETISTMGQALDAYSGKAIQEQAKKIEDIVTQGTKQSQAKGLLDLEASLRANPIGIAKITEILEKASGGVVALGSQALEDTATQLEQVIGASKGSIDRGQLASDLQRINQGILEAEAVRKEYVQDFQKAVDAFRKDKGDLKAKGILDAYDKLSLSQKLALASNVETYDDANKVFEIKSNAANTELRAALEQSSGSTTGDILAKRIKEASNFYKEYLRDSAGNDSVAFRSLQAQLLSAVESGQTELVKGILKVTEGSFPAQLAAKAESNRRALLSKPFKEAIKENQQDAPTTKRELPDINQAESTFVSRQAEIAKKNVENDGHKGQLDTEIRLRRAELNKFAEEAVAILDKDNTTQEQALQLSDELNQKKVELLKLTDQRSKLEADQLVGDETLKAAQRSQIAGAEQLKVLQEKLKVLHGTKVHSAEEEAALLNEIYRLERSQLDSEKAALAKTLANEVKKEGLFNPEGASPEQLVETLSKKGFATAFANSEDLANAFKALVEVVDRERGIREKYLSEIEDAQRKELDAKLAASKKAYDTQQSRTTSLENNLQNATQKLQSARDKLAASYEKQAELEEFFANSLREISGKPLTVSDVQDTLAQAQGSGSTDLAKQAVGQIKELLNSGKINRGDAESLTLKARDIALQQNQQELAYNAQQVRFAAEQVDALSLQLAESQKAEKGLKESVDALTLQIEKLHETVAGTIPNEGAKPAVTTKTLTPEEAKAVAEQARVESQGSGNKAQVFSRYQPAGTEAPQVTVEVGGTPFNPPQISSGADYMQGLANLTVDPNFARAVDVAPMPDLSAPQQAATNQLQPVTFNVGGVSIDTLAKPDVVAQFTAAMKLQSLKTGRPL